MNKTIYERLLGNTSLQLWCLWDSFPLFSCSFYGEGNAVFPSEENITKFYWSTNEASVFFCYFLLLLLLFFFGLGLCFNRSLMLSWVSLNLPSQWTSAYFQTGKGMNRNGSNLFFEFFFPNNINFTAFYAYHHTITLWFSFISFNFLLWKYVTKMFRKNERFSLSERTANFQVIFLLSVVELSGK